jgi:hypothetical protein
VSIAHSWGSTAEERALHFPCDDFIPNAEGIYFRAIDVTAPEALVFRWLCQLRCAPYSYDWIDNAGRRSPCDLMPGLEHLEIGQRVMRIFRLVAFEYDRHITIVMDTPQANRLFGEIAVTYAVRPGRLVVKLRVRHSRGVMRWLLPWGDLIMMRKQLLTLKALAERS